MQDFKLICTNFIFSWSFPNS